MGNLERKFFKGRRLGVPLTAAEKQKRYRDKKSNAFVTGIVTRVTKPEQSSVTVVGPLSVYSEHRWSYLQSRGHIWHEELGYSTRPGPHGSVVRGVTVPGDPAYQGVAS